MPIVVFTVPGTPFAQPRHQIGRTKTGQRVAYLPKLRDRRTGEFTREHPAVAWKTAVGLYANSNKHPDWPIPKGQAVGLVCAFQKPAVRHARTQDWVSVPDWDNLAKAIADSLRGIAFDDDSQVIRGIELKDYSSQPGATVRIVWGESLDRLRDRLAVLLEALE